MFNTWRQDSSVVEVNLAETPVYELPEVVAAQDNLKAALTELEHANQTVRELRQILSVQNNETNAVAILQARAQWSQATLEQQMAEERSRAARRELERVQHIAAQIVADARIPGRKPLIRQLFDQLEVCVALAEKVRVYDDKTQQLGASRPEAPCPELLPGWSSAENAVQYRRRAFKEWLE